VTTFNSIAQVFNCTTILPFLFANRANRAVRAEYADRAAYADRAKNADRATYADRAKNADRADFAICGLYFARPTDPDLHQ